LSHGCSCVLRGYGWQTGQNWRNRRNYWSYQSTICHSALSLERVSKKDSTYMFECTHILAHIYFTTYLLSRPPSQTMLLQTMFRRSKSPSKEVTFVWCVFHQKEPTAYSGHARGERSINATCIGVYETEKAANAAALSLWKIRGLPCDKGREMDGWFFWNATEHSLDSSTLSEKVFVKRARLRGKDR